jgi:hypothetical protein
MPYLEISRPTKKLLLFVSMENPFWRLLFGPNPKQEEVAEIVGVTSPNLSNWKKTGRIGKVPDFNGIMKRIEDVKVDKSAKDTAVDQLSAFIRSYGNNAEHQYKTAEIFLMPIDECQKIVDNIIYGQQPCFPIICYSKPSDAAAHFERYGGAYYMWVERGNRWLQCGLRVRYPLEIQSEITIRCKISFPRVREPGKRVEYDGFMAAKHPNVYWMFEKRGTEKDVFHFITRGDRYCKSYDDKDNKGIKILTLAGKYISADQDESQSIVSERVILQWKEMNDRNSMELFISTSAKVLEPDVSSSIELLWDEYQSR